MRKKQSGYYIIISRKKLGCNYIINWRPSNSRFYYQLIQIPSNFKYLYTYGNLEFTIEAKGFNILPNTTVVDLWHLCWNLSVIEVKCARHNLFSRFIGWLLFCLISSVKNRTHSIKVFVLPIKPMSHDIGVTFTLGIVAMENRKPAVSVLYYSKRHHIITE